MHRVLSILLLVLLGLPLAAPLLAPNAETNLRACCRRNGAHRCMAMDMTGTMSTAFVKAGSHLSIVSEKCPYFPKALIAAHAQQWLTQRPQSRFVTTVAHPSALPQTEARYRIAFSRSRQKRGPPFRIV